MKEKHRASRRRKTKMKEELRNSYKTSAQLNQTPKQNKQDQEHTQKFYHEKSKGPFIISI